MGSAEDRYQVVNMDFLHCFRDSEITTVLHPFKQGGRTVVVFGISFGKKKNPRNLAASRVLVVETTGLEPVTSCV